MKNLIRAVKQRLKEKFPFLVKVARLILQNNLNPISVRRGGQKSALICYITPPFRTQNHRCHSNQKEVIIMADVLADLDFSVDVVDYHSEYDINYCAYDLLIGFGQAFARSFSDINFQGKRILHLTGANPNFSNEAEARRAQSLYERRGVLLQPRREVYWSWMYSAINSDAIFVLGNNWTLLTYEGLNNNTRLIPVPYVKPLIQEAIEKDWENARHRFCWFGGGGALHKGLDLVLEAIDCIGSDYHLDVCGPVGHESDFTKLYEKSLFANTKVTFHGFVDVESQAMRTILGTNVFVIFPSCSEGGGSSVITCMAAGLIPIVTKEASVEIGDFGFLIDSSDVSSVVSAMRKAGSLNNEELIIRSEKAVMYAREKHSYEAYEQALRKSILEVIN